MKSKLQNGQTVWEFRWRDRTSGKPVYGRIVLGNTQQFATEREAWDAVAGIVLEINGDDPRLPKSKLTMSLSAKHGGCASDCTRTQQLRCTHRNTMNCMDLCPTLKR